MSGAPDDDRTRSREADAMVRTALWILLAYLCASALPVARWSMMTHAWAPLLIHAAVILLVITVAASEAVPAAVKEWTPLLVAPYLYIELRWAIPGAGQPHADALIVDWEAILFPTNPSQTLAYAWPSRPLSELLHLCYLSYYLLMYLPPILLWLRGRRREYAATLVALVVVYSTCFLSYIALPVDGPRFVHGPSLAPEGPVRALVLAVLESGSARGSAFPSSHVAASVVAAIYALRFQRATGWVVTALAAGLAIGAVYGGYHYAVDIVAGLLVGLSSAGLAYGVEHRILRYSRATN